MNTTLFDIVSISPPTSVELQTVIDRVISQIKDSNKPTIKPLASVLSYAVKTAEDGNAGLLDEILLAVSRSSQGSSWVRSHIGPLIDQMLSTWDSDVRVRIAVHALSYVEDAWFHAANKHIFVVRWVSAASRLEYTPEIGQSVVEVLLRMACMYHWRPHITREAWRWLERRPQLPPVCRARSLCCNDLGAISKVESLGNIEILKGYLIVVWSEWDWLAPWVCSYMCTVIRKHFGGEREKGHRDELRDRLLHIQNQLDLGLDHLRKLGSEMTAACFQPTKEAYEALMETLSEVGILSEVETLSEVGSVQIRISRETTSDEDSDSPVSSQALTSPYHQPTSPYRQPTSPYRQPISPYRQPISPYRQPISPYRQPTSPYQRPPSPYQRPPSPYQRPPSPYQ